MKFMEIEYLIRDGEKNKRVKGFAFQTPGWPEFHACVRYGNRWGIDSSVFDDWILDHYETGLALSCVGSLSRKDLAPKMLKDFLDKLGKERVHEVLLRNGVDFF